jgi:hypothetical protein
MNVYQNNGTKNKEIRAAIIIFFGKTVTIQLPADLFGLGS